MSTSTLGAKKINDTVKLIKDGKLSVSANLTEFYVADIKKVLDKFSVKYQAQASKASLLKLVAKEIEKENAKRHPAAIPTVPKTVAKTGKRKRKITSTDPDDSDKESDKDSDELFGTTSKSPAKKMAVDSDTSEDELFGTSSKSPSKGKSTTATANKVWILSASSILSNLQKIKHSQNLTHLVAISASDLHIDNAILLIDKGDIIIYTVDEILRSGIVVNSMQKASAHKTFTLQHDTPVYGLTQASIEYFKNLFDDPSRFNPANVIAMRERDLTTSKRQVTFHDHEPAKRTQLFESEEILDAFARASDKGKHTIASHTGYPKVVMEVFSKDPKGARETGIFFFNISKTHLVH
jgi:hypothetical protein